MAACHDELMANQSLVATATARLRDAQSALRVTKERAGDLRRELMQGAHAALGEVDDAWVDANGLKETLKERDELLSEKIRKVTEVRRQSRSPDQLNRPPLPPKGDLWMAYSPPSSGVQITVAAQR